MTNMKAKYKFLSLFLTATTFVGCQDMDLLPEGEFVTDKQKETVAELNPVRAKDKVNAIFATFSQYMPNKTALGAERHNDIGYPTIMMAMSANGMDEVSDNNGYNWMGYSLTFEDRSYTMNECIMVWNDLYSIIYAANKVVAEIDENTEDPEQQFFLAQGLGARGFAYWVLAQLYQFTYVDAKDELCVPVITDKNQEDAVENGCKRSTVEQVYTQINTDLTKAIELLTAAEGNKYKRSDKRYISLAVAYGLRARMNLTMQNMSEALADANAAIEKAKGENLSPLSIEKAGQPGFNSSEETNWMWGIIVNEKDAVVTSAICNWPSHFGSLSYGYANFSGGVQISKSLYAQIKDTDVRKKWWLTSTGEGMDGYLSDEQAQYVEKNGYKPLTQVKFAPYNNVVGTSINASDIPLMRVEEMYLIKAEAEGEGAGKTTLQDFIKEYRDPSYSVPSTDFKDEVYLQRRIELWGEGMGWFDIMRLKKGVDRRGCGYPNASSVFNIEPDDNILLWRIPEAEIQANKALSPSDSPATVLPKPVADI